MMYEVYRDGFASYLFFTEAQAREWLRSHDDGIGYSIRLYKK